MLRTYKGKKNGNGQLRKSKEDISNLMVSMGLQQPESPSKSQSSKQNKKTNKKETKAKTPSVETQLQFTRNGHAVLRNIISPAVIADIKKVCKVIICLFTEKLFRIH